MQLYTISFTTKKLSHKYDDKGKNIIATSQLDTPITMTALPLHTARSYSGCDNFTITEYQPDQKREYAKPSGASHAWGGPATKKVDRSAYAKNEAKSAGPARASKSSAVESAAKTGNLSGAING